MSIKDKFDLAVKEKGINDPETLRLSKIWNKVINRQQRWLNAYSENKR